MDTPLKGKKVTKVTPLKKQSNIIEWEVPDPDIITHMRKNELSDHYDMSLL